MEKMATKNAEKLKEIKSLTQESLKALGKKHFALISHGASFPAYEGQNVGIGNPVSDGAKALVDFSEGIFNCLQLGPAGKTKAVDSSPYTGTIFSNNPLFIDLKALTTEQWGEVLSSQTFEEIVNNNPNQGQNKAAYSYIFSKHEKAMNEAFRAYQQKLQAKDAFILKIEKDFSEYKKQNHSWLEKDAVYEALSVKHGNDYWPLWEDDLDRNLYNSKDDVQSKLAQDRLEQTKKDYAEVIEFYSFCQYVASAQKEQMLDYSKAKGIKMIADRQVAFSDRDVWAYQSLFMDGWFLGCPPDYFSEDGQAWGFPMVDPKKTFNTDGSLAEGGELIKALFKKMFHENPGGVRIDHIVGLIDPWVYKAGYLPKPEEGAGRLFSSPEHPELSQYAIATMDDLDHEMEPDKEHRIKKLNKDQVKRYGALIEKIVIAAAEEEGLSKDAIVCEDLGTVTYPVEQVMKEYDLLGMRLTQFVVPEKPKHPYRCKNIEARSWAMVGTHDNEPIAMWADQTVNTEEGYLHAQNLTEDLLPKEREFQKDDMIQRLNTDSDYLRKTKLYEMFASKSENIQVFFTDFFGIYDVYNRPGTSGDENWSLRIPDNFEEFYFEQLAQCKGMNLPEIFRLAIEARGKDFVVKNKELVNKLQKLEEDLKRG